MEEIKNAVPRMLKTFGVSSEDIDENKDKQVNFLLN